MKPLQEHIEESIHLALGRFENGAGITECAKWAAEEIARHPWIAKLPSAVERAKLAEAMQQAKDALEGDSNDDEHDALCLLAEALGITSRTIGTGPACPAITSLDLTQSSPYVMNGGTKRGWYIQWPNGFESAMPDEATARRCAASAQLFRCCERSIMALAANGAPNCEAVKECRAAIAASST